MTYVLATVVGPLLGRVATRVIQTGAEHIARVTEGVCDVHEQLLVGRVGRYPAAVVRIRA